MVAKELFLYPLTGLFEECHEIQVDALRDARTPEYKDAYSLRNINNLWWKEAISRENLGKIEISLRSRYAHSMPDVELHRIVLADFSAFAKKFDRSINDLSNINLGPERLFSALETINVFCILYSDFISYPRLLSIQSGLITNELDTRVIFKEAMDCIRNPYYEFILKNAKNVIDTAKADIAWIVGPPRISTIQMAIYQRKAMPNSHISIVGHSSEYYSMNKISDLLAKNDILFSLVDSIILDDFENTAPQLYDAVSHGAPLQDVPNIMFVDKTTEKIVTNRYLQSSHRDPLANARVHEASLNSFPNDPDFIDAGSIVTAKLWPNSKCFWSSCNFCGINKKYNTLPQNNFSSLDGAISIFNTAKDSGAAFVWSIDEAIPPENLYALACRIIDEGIEIFWETRSKIHKGFTNEVCRKLAESGLREIRLGLESASPRVLGLMGKQPEGWTLDIVREVVSNFHNAGVSVHFPCIVGFPTETEEERRETFRFLSEIRGECPSVTFNLNILGLDVASALFQRSELFAIDEIKWPCNPKYFLGNLIDWNCKDEPFNYDHLDFIRNEFMRSELYPWMPTTATMPVYMFYRLAETSRATLAWKAARSKTGDWLGMESDVDLESQKFVLTEGLVDCGPPANVSQDIGRATTLLYDWETHHRLDVSPDLQSLIEAFREPGALPARTDNSSFPALLDLCNLGILVKV